MRTRNRPKRALPCAIDARLAGWPAKYRAAVARLIDDIGEARLELLVCALSQKARGRRSYDGYNEPLLLQMAKLRRKYPERTLHQIADLVVKSPAGKEECKRSNCEQDSLRRRLITAWRKHGPRVSDNAARQDGFMNAPLSAAFIQRYLSHLAIDTEPLREDREPDTVKLLAATDALAQELVDSIKKGYARSTDVLIHTILDQVARLIKAEARRIAAVALGIVKSGSDVLQ